MSLFGAMTASVSGIGAQGQAISVISDNLANTNTIGYKASRTLFSQMVTNSGASGTMYNSGGVGTAVQRSQMTQGSFITSTSKTDLAISGNGFFRVADNKVNTTATTQYFTRAGSFAEDKEGYLVNPDGFYLQGWKVTTTGAIQNIQEPVAIELQSVGVSAKQTENYSIKANLKNTETVNSIYNTFTGANLDAVLSATLNDPTRADYVADVRVYDAQGGARDMTIHFTKRAANTWDWQLVADSGDIQAGSVPATAISTDGSLVRVGGGTLEFATNGGALLHATNTDVNIQWANGVAASEIKFNFGDYKAGQTSTITSTAGVMAVSVEGGDLSTTGAYQLVSMGGNSFELRDGATVLGTVSGLAATGTRELYFPANPPTLTAAVRITVGDSFDETAAATTVMGDFTIAGHDALLNGIGTNGMTQLDSAYNTSGVSQDGFGAGSLASISVDADGFINGSFTNGEVKKLYKIALAAFQNPAGLEVVSGSLLRATDASGQALLKEPGVGGMGRMVAGSLEGSTTDIAGEFSNMIVAQRAFQASSKVITTVDQMLNELLQLR